MNSATPDSSDPHVHDAIRHRHRTRMTNPRCPNCGESMSSVEKGYGGVWSCLYCEGTWLPSEQRAASAALRDDALKQAVQLPIQSLVCPSCESRAFLATSAEGAYVCGACGSLFLDRGVLDRLAPQASSPSKEAPVAQALAGAIGSAFVGDPVSLVQALIDDQPHRE
jgi:ribosomal protein L37AE/L43A